MVVTELSHDNLIYKLKEYTSSGALAMHMPGHKRNAEAFKWLAELDFGIDITEINGFDNLNCPESIFKTMERRAAKLFGAHESILLVNGSTCGILASVRAALGGCGHKAPPGDILILRGSHMSLYNAAEITGANVNYIVPAMHKKLGIWGSVAPESVENLLDELKKDGASIKLVAITSPTYEGIISDIASIADICHRMGVLLLVDEAHGAHLGFADFNDLCPECSDLNFEYAEHYKNGSLSAVKAEADIIVQSLHKTLPCLTQTAVLHINKSAADMGLDASAVRRNVSIFQSSSPSYILSSSICGCIEYLEMNGAKAAHEWSEALDSFYESVKGLRHISVVHFGTSGNSVFARDKSKIIISACKTGISGAHIMSIMRDGFNIELEMCAGNYALAMTGMGDTCKSLGRLSEALWTIDNDINNYDINNYDINHYAINNYACDSMPSEMDFSSEADSSCALPEKLLKINEALACNGRRVSINECAGMVSCEYIWAYPPGAPIIVPGEVVSSALCEAIMKLYDSGVRIHSSRGEAPGYIFCTDIQR